MLKTEQNYMDEKGFGFISWKGEEEWVHFSSVLPWQWLISTRAIVFAKEANGLTLLKDMCVSFKQEEGTKGPLAKDVRQEDPARVARITAKVHFGKVEVRVAL